MVGPKPKESGRTDSTCVFRQEELLSARHSVTFSFIRTVTVGSGIAPDLLTIPAEPEKDPSGMRSRAFRPRALGLPRPVTAGGDFHPAPRTCSTRSISGQAGLKWGKQAKIARRLLLMRSMSQFDCWARTLQPKKKREPSPASRSTLQYGSRKRPRVGGANSAPVSPDKGPDSRHHWRGHPEGRSTGRYGGQP